MVGKFHEIRKSRVKLHEIACNFISLEIAALSSTGIQTSSQMAHECSGLPQAMHSCAVPHCPPQATQLRLILNTDSWAAAAAAEPRGA